MHLGTAYGQDVLPRPYILIVITYDFSVHDCAKLASSSSTFTRILRPTSEQEPLRSKNVSSRETIFTGNTQITANVE